MKMVDKSSKLVDKFAAVASSGSGGAASGPLNMPGGGGTGSGAAGSGSGGGAPGSAGLSGSGGGFSASQKPVPMKLFAAWEVDRTPPNCIPR